MSFSVQERFWTFWFVLGVGGVTGNVEVGVGDDGWDVD